MINIKYVKIILIILFLCCGKLDYYIKYFLGKNWVIINDDSFMKNFFLDLEKWNVYVYFNE